MKRYAQAVCTIVLCVSMISLFGATASAAPRQADDSNGSISLDRLQGPIGTSVTVTGKNYPAGQTVSIFCTGCDLPNNYHDLDANNQWTFTITHSDPADPTNIGVSHAFFYANGGYGPGQSDLFLITGS